MNRTCLSVMLIWMSLTGCMPDLTSEHPPERIYWLETTSIENPPPVSLRLRVVPGLDSDRIQVLEEDQRLNFYAGAYWPDNLQPLLESLISRALNAGGAHPQMSVLIERFFAVSRGDSVPPRIELGATFRFEEATCRFEQSRPSASQRLRDIVAAHQTLLDELAAVLAASVRTGRCA